jgi:hypothetical protein
VTLEQLTVIFLFVGVRRMMTRRRRMMSCKHLAGVASLGGSGHILLLLGPLLVMRDHPELRKVEDKLDNKDGLDKTVTYQTSPVLIGLVRPRMHWTSSVWTGQVRSIIVLRPKSCNFTNQYSQEIEKD